MDAAIEAIQNVVSSEPELGEQQGTAQPDDGAIETRLTEEISSLWSEHTRLSADRKVTSKELRLLRARLAQTLHQMKALLARPGRGGEWRGWLRQQGIPRSSADRLVARYAETLGTNKGEELHNGAIPESPEDSAEKLATAVWSSSLKKVLVTGESVFQFLASIAQISGIPHERRQEGLMIFNHVPKAADGVTGTGVSAEATCPASLPPEGDGNPADAPAADPAPQLLDEVSAATQEPSEVTAATPPEAGETAAVVDESGGAVA
jgi:hypothetical protein